MSWLMVASVETGLDVYPGLPHGFRRYDGLEASRQWDIDTMQAIRRLLAIK